MEDDYYVILEIERSATQEEIRRAYRKLAMKYHPDKSKDPETQEHFKKVSEAYQVLSDEEKKQLYDQFGKEGVQHGGNPHAQQDVFNTGFMDPNELFKQFFGGSGGFGGMHNMFNQHFNFQTSSSPSSHQQEVRRVTVEIPLNQFVTGGPVEYQYKKVVLVNNEGEELTDDKYIVCKGCQGTGQSIKRFQQGPFIQQMISTCETCRGKGKSQPNGYFERARKITKQYTLPVMHMNETIIIREGNDIVELTARRKADDGFPFWEVINGNTLLYKPKLHIMEGILKSMIACPHPDGNVYNIMLPSIKHKTIMVQGKGIKGGDLAIEIDWLWEMSEFTPMLDYLRELQQHEDLSYAVKENMNRFLQL